MKKFELPHQHSEKSIGNIKSELSDSKRFIATSEIFKQLSDFNIRLSFVNNNNKKNS